MAEIHPFQPTLCPACGCPVEQQNILFKSLYVQILNECLSPGRGYLLPCLCTLLQSMASCACASLWYRNWPHCRGRPPSPGPHLWSCLLCMIAWTRSGGFGLWVLSGSPQGLCVVGVLRLGPWHPAGSQQWAEGVGHRAVCQRVGAYPPPCLRCHDFADLFRCSGWLSASPVPQVSPKSWLVKEGHEWWDLLHTLPSRPISDSRKQSGYRTKKVWLSDVSGFLGALLWSILQWPERE